jgi:hypothetical protein
MYNIAINDIAIYKIRYIYQLTYLNVIMRSSRVVIDTNSYYSN